MIRVRITEENKSKLDARIRSLEQQLPQFMSSVPFAETSTLPPDNHPMDGDRAEDDHEAGEPCTGPNLRVPHSNRRGLTVQYTDTGLDTIEDTGSARLV